MKFLFLICLSTAEKLLIQANVIYFHFLFIRAHFPLIFHILIYIVHAISISIHLYDLSLYLFH